MTTHDRDKIIALREEADKFATNELSCEGEYHPDFHTVSDEHFYAIAFAAGSASRDAEIEELVAALESLIDMDVAYQRGRKVVEAVENACAVLAKVRKT